MSTMRAVKKESSTAYRETTECIKDWEIIAMTGL